MAAIRTSYGFGGRLAAALASSLLLHLGCLATEARAQTPAAAVLGLAGGTAEATLTPTSTPIPPPTATSTREPTFAIVDETGCAIDGGGPTSPAAQVAFGAAVLLLLYRQSIRRRPANAPVES